MPYSLQAAKLIPRFRPNRSRRALIPQAGDVLSSTSTDLSSRQLLLPSGSVTTCDPASDFLREDPSLNAMIEATRGQIEAIELFSASMLRNPFNTADSLAKVKEAALRQDPRRTYLQVTALERSLLASSNVDSQWGGQLIRRTLNQQLNSAYAQFHGKYPDEPAAALSVVTQEEMAAIIDHVYEEYTQSGVAGEWIHSVDKAIPPDINDWLLFDDRTKFNEKAVYHRVYRSPTCMRIIGPPNNDDLPLTMRLGTPAKAFLELMTFRSGPLRNGAHMEPWMRFMPGKVFELVRNHVTRFWRQYADYRNKRVKIHMTAMRKELPHFLAIINIKLWSLALVQELEKAQLRQRKIDCNGRRSAYEALVQYSGAELISEALVKEAFALHNYNDMQLEAPRDQKESTREFKKVRIADPSKRWVLDNIATRRIPAEGDDDDFLLPYLVDWETAKLGSRARPLPNRPMKGWLHSLGDVTSYAITHEFVTALAGYCLQYNSNVLVVGPDSTRLCYFLTEYITAQVPESQVKLIAIEILSEETTTDKHRPWGKSKGNEEQEKSMVEPVTSFPKHLDYRPALCPYTGRLKWPPPLRATLNDFYNHFSPQTAVVTSLDDGVDEITPKLRTMGCLKRYLVLGPRSSGSAYHTWGILPLGCPERRISPVHYDGWEIAGDLGKVSRHILHPYMARNQFGEVDPGLLWALSSAATLFRRRHR